MKLERTTSNKNRQELEGSDSLPVVGILRQRLNLLRHPGLLRADFPHVVQRSLAWLTIAMTLVAPAPIVSPREWWRFFSVTFAVILALVSIILLEHAR